VTNSALAADDGSGFFAGVAGRFRASKPAAIMSYDVTYALFNIRLKRVASATLTATEGIWHNTRSGEWTPAYMVDFYVASPQNGAGNIALFKRTLSVMTMPDLKLITYIKQNDECIRTFSLKTKKGVISVPLLARKLAVLHADVRNGRDDEDRNESFSMWCMPFRDFSRETSDPELRKLAETSLECSMLPLSGEVALFLGSLQCTLAGIRTEPLKNHAPALAGNGLDPLNKPNAFLTVSQ
jgi:hypothetical protein